jgi:hypothetical protein
VIIMLLGVTNDLMAAAPIENAARQLGITCRVVSLPQIENLNVGQSVRLIVLDLNAIDQVMDAIAELRDSLGESIPIVAFGPHVHAGKLSAARQAGCSQVLTRGQFHQKASAVMAAALADAPES